MNCTSCIIFFELRAVKMKVCTFFLLVTVASSAVAAKSYDGYKVALPD